jgi:hypothetical protein
VFPSGGVSIGSTTDTGAGNLYVKGGGSAGGAYPLIVHNSSSTELCLVRDDGYFKTGLASFSPYNLTTGSAANLFVASDGGLARSTSSIRYKTDVQNAIHGLNELLKLRAVTYKGKNDGDIVFGGLIAEEVNDIGLTEFVQYNDAGEPDALAYGNMVSLCVKAIQELKQQFDAYVASHP